MFIEFTLFILWDTWETLRTGCACIDMPEVHKFKKFLSLQLHSLLKRSSSRKFDAE